MSAIDEAVSATVRYLELRKQLGAASAEREAAVRAMHYEDEIPKVHVGERLRTRLSIEGLTEECIDTLGVSDWSIRNMLDKKV